MGKMGSKIFYHIHSVSVRELETANLAEGGPTLVVEAVGIEPTSEQVPWEGLLVE